MDRSDQQASAMMASDAAHEASSFARDSGKMGSGVKDTIDAYKESAGLHTEAADAHKEAGNSAVAEAHQAASVAANRVVDILTSSEAKNKKLFEKAGRVLSGSNEKRIKEAMGCHEEVLKLGEGHASPAARALVKEAHGHLDSVVKSLGDATAEVGEIDAKAAMAAFLVKSTMEQREHLAEVLKAIRDAERPNRSLDLYRTLTRQKFNNNHDESGRFAEGAGGGSGGFSGSGGSSSGHSTLLAAVNSASSEAGKVQSRSEGSPEAKVATRTAVAATAKAEKENTPAAHEDAAKAHAAAAELHNEAADKHEYCYENGLSHSGPVDPGETNSSGQGWGRAAPANEATLNAHGNAITPHHRAAAAHKQAAAEHQKIRDELLS
jgi:hypothetical protein